MRVVLYTNDLEPITVLELSEFAKRHLEVHRRVRLPVYESLSRMVAPLDGGPSKPCPKYVDIWSEIFVRCGDRHMFLFTHDDEAALLLRAAFLPGQQRALNDHRAQAFADGFLHALRELR